MNTAPITRLLASICIGMYPWRIHQKLSLGLFSLCPASIIHTKEYYRVVTCHFFHADLWQLGWNMYSLFKIGPRLEQKWGSRKYVGAVLTGMAIMPCMNYLLDTALNMISPRNVATNRESMGLAGVVFQLSALYALASDSSAIDMGLGYKIPARAYPFVSLAISPVVGEVANFRDHVAGVVTGLLQLPFVESTLMYGRSFPGQGHKLGTSKNPRVTCSTTRKQDGGSRAEVQEGNVTSESDIIQQAKPAQVQRKKKGNERIRRRAPAA